MYWTLRRMRWEIADERRSGLRGVAAELAGSPEAISAKVAERPEGGHTMSSEVERAVEFRALEAEMALAVDPAASSQARAIALWHMKDLLNRWKSTPMPQDLAEAIHRTAMIDRLERFESQPEKFIPAKTIEAPPGMPIGDDDDRD